MNIEKETVFLNRIICISQKVEQREQLQNELVEVLNKTPKSKAVIETKRKEIRELSQSILDWSLWMQKQSLLSNKARQKKLALFIEIFKAEQRQSKGYLVSPSISLAFIGGLSDVSTSSQNTKDTRVA